MTFPTFSSPAPDAWLEAAYDDTYDTYDDAPWGEQQEQVDWLESRYDDYDAYEYDCELTEDDYTHDGMDD